MHTHRKTINLLNYSTCEHDEKRNSCGVKEVQLRSDFVVSTEWPVVLRWIIICEAWVG